ncbi:DEAD/DEAH box helicase [Pedosphaera parvula]|uniref:Non-specific serine/threonine protein kinase n=1 Tax=Pedosphaera parvula (strain Ellin514) TaxID=320771 RepID=B9XCR6_PEDPL|nr:DEAD/DEAH box helicase [Pedosphaera parvula]EEF62262.1 Non-specific serine/threonine protein kinase [Pedosphaera parvula Ellin514]
MPTLVLPSTAVQASEFMHSLPSNAQARGERYFVQDRIPAIRQTSPNEFSATIEGSQIYRVTLWFDAQAGWDADCSCPIGFDCKHIYAAMRALLAEYSSPSMHQLSDGSAPSTASKPSSKPKPSSGNFADDVKRALNRALKAEEKSFLKRLDRIYKECTRYGNISQWHFEQLGLKLKVNGWGPLHIWPSFPNTLREFWLYVANAVQEQGSSVPAFLQPVTNLDEIRQKLQSWRREQEIEQWKQTLDQSLSWSAPAVATKTNPCQLRVRFTEQAAVLEWKLPGRENFEAVKAAQARTLQGELQNGRTVLAPELEWLWETFSSRLDFGSRPELPYSDASPLKKLGRLFRMPEFNDLLVNTEGQPFERPDATLRWRFDSPADTSGDYRFYLERTDGLPMPPVLCEIEGRPALFVTRAAVFRGPSTESDILAPNRDNLIPAPALESRSGAMLLHSLNLEMPPRLRERVRTIPLHLAITCALAESYPGSNSEICTIQIQAQSPDGKAVEIWNGNSWLNAQSQVLHSSKKAKNEAITLFDRSSLYDASSLLTAFDARWESYAGLWSIRVTKKFPEQFAVWLKSLPSEIKIELKGELASLAQDAIAGRVRLDVAEAEMDWFDLRVVLDVTDTTLTQEELNLLLNARGGYVRLQGKGWRKLHFNLDAEEDEQLARLGLNPRELTAAPQRLHALQLAEHSAKKFLPEEQFENVQRRAGEIKARVTLALPESIQATLRPYQQEGFHFLAYLAENRFGGILADDMGLGKTLQTLSWLQWLRGSGKAQITPSLVVCPKSVMDNWCAEAARFAPGLKVKVWTASSLDQLLRSLNEADLHVMNYSQLRLIGESLAPVNWLAVILDEGQYIKNPNSQTAQVARALKAQHRLVLSGTPIENRLLDLWSLMNFAMPGILGSRTQFARLYDAKEDPFARRRLSARVRPFLLRRTKSQVAKDLPDRIEEDLYCEMEGEQKTLYRAELKRAQQMLLRVKTQKEFAKERFHFLTSLLRLRQISCHPRLVKPESRASSAKVDALFEQLEPLVEEGQKVLVFSQFVDMLDILRTDIEAKGWPLFYLAGDTENRGELVQRFQATEGAAVFLISLKAGGFGLNLTAASYVVLFDPWWNPAVENQAIDRTHRIGQSRNVIAYRLLIKESIEEKIRQLQKQKSSLADDVLGEEKFAQSLTMQDLEFLLSDAP